MIILIVKIEEPDLWNQKLDERSYHWGQGSTGPGPSCRESKWVSFIGLIRAINSDSITAARVPC